MIVMTAWSWGERTVFTIQGKQEGHQSTFLLMNKTFIKKYLKELSM